MSVTDPNNERPSRWSFKEWFGEITGGFFGGGKTIIPGGGVGTPSGKPGAPPPAALLARKRASDKYTGSALKSRMEEAKAKNMVWENNLEPLVIAKLRGMFHQENFSRMKLDPSLWSNQMRRVICDLSMLYQSPARRRLDVEDDEQAKKQQTEDSNPAKASGDPATAPKPDAVDGGEGAVKKDAGPPPPNQAGDAPASGVADQVDSGGAPSGPDTGDPDVDALADVLDLEGAAKPSTPSPLDVVLKMINLDVYMDLIEKKVRFHDCVWLRPIVTFDRTEMVDDPEQGQQEVGDPATGKLSLVVYDPSCAEVVEDPENPAKAIAFYYWANELMANGTLEARIHFFTKDEYWKFDKEWKELDHAPNPLGRLPVTKFTAELPSNGSYYVNGSGRDLYNGTLELCVLRTIQNTRFRDSGFKQVAITADQEAVDSDQVMGGPTPIFLPEGGSAMVLDLQPMIAEMTDMCSDRQLEMAAKYGISPAEYKSEGGPQSGFAKKLDMDKVLKENKRIRKFFAEGEQDFYNLLAITLNTHKIKDVPTLDPEAELCVDFAEPDFVENPETQVATDAKEIDLNLTSIVDILKRRNPDLSEVELVELAYRNKRINEALIPQEAKSLWDMMAQPASVSAAKAYGGGGGAPPGKGGPPMSPGAPKPPAGPPAPAGAKPPPFGGKK